MDELLPGLTHAPNVHPVFVHFPIVLWLTALLFSGLGALAARPSLLCVGRWLLYLGVLAAVPTVLTGLDAMAPMEGAPGHDLVHTHMWWMVAATGLALLTAVVAFTTARRARRSQRQRTSTNWATPPWRASPNAAPGSSKVPTSTSPMRTVTRSPSREASSANRPSCTRPDRVTSRNRSHAPSRRRCTRIAPVPETRATV